MIQVKVGDGRNRAYEAGITAGDVIRDALGRKHGACAALVDSVECDFSHVIEKDCRLEPILEGSDAGLFADGWLKVWPGWSSGYCAVGHGAS